MVPYMHGLGIVMQAWYPFGGRGHTGEILNDPTVTAIAQAHNRTAAQVILRWHLQRGIVVIPKSVRKERMAENFNVFDFTLSDDDMQTIAGLDKDTSSFFSHTDPSMVEWFVKMVEERKNTNDAAKKNQ